MRSCIGRLVRAGVAILVFVAGSAWAEGGKEAAPSEAVAQKAVLEYLEGEVTVDGVAAEFGQEVNVGAKVKTGDNSYCEIVFGSRNILKITQNAIAVISIDQTHSEVALESGGFGAVLNKLQSVAGGEVAFRVKTQAAVCGVRGTVFFVQVESPDSTVVCTCNGTVEYSDAAGDNVVESTATHHHGYRITRADGRIVESDASMQYHDDAFMNELAAKIGVTIPWE